MLLWWDEEGRRRHICHVESDEVAGGSDEYMFMFESVI
jgi:hypothetical protein